MKRLPKWPKGLKAKLARLTRKAEHQKKIDARKKEIADAKKAVANLITNKKPKSK